MPAPSLGEILLDELLNLAQNQQQTALLQTLVNLVNTIDQRTSAMLTLEQTIFADIQGALPQIEILENQILQRLSAIIVALGAPQQAGQPVTLPATPPPGYGGGSPSDIASAVWRFDSFDVSSEVMGQVVDDIWFRTQMLTTGGWITGSKPWGLALFGGENFGPEPQLVAGLNAPISNVLPTDTVFSWLHRNNPTYPMSVDSNGEVLFGTDPGSPGFQPFRVWWTDALMHAMASGFASTAPTVPPVWPGLANVTLGTSLALSDGLTVPGPLDGVLVVITSVPVPIGFYPFGAVKSFVHAGGIIFKDDDDNFEQAQGLGLEDQVICPKTMQRASSAIIRLKSGVMGTITPWVKT